MSLANKLGNIYIDLNTALNDTNSALLEKGGNEVVDILSIGDEIRRLESGGTDEIAMGILDGSATTLILPNVTTIRGYAFVYHPNLSSIVIPDSVTDIGEFAFTGCTNLSSVTIGKGIRTIGDNAFATGDDKFKDLYLYTNTPPILGSLSGSMASTIIHIPIGSGEAYKSATNWSNLADNIVEDIVVE